MNNQMGPVVATGRIVADWKEYRSASRNKLTLSILLNDLNRFCKVNQTNQTKLLREFLFPDQDVRHLMYSYYEAVVKYTHPGTVHQQWGDYLSFCWFFYGDLFSNRPWSPSYSQIYI